MNHTITTTLSEEYYSFLLTEAKRMNSSKKAILELALKAYRKQTLQEAVEAGFRERQEEYLALQEEYADAQGSSLHLQ